MLVRETGGGGYHTRHVQKESTGSDIVPTESAAPMMGRDLKVLRTKALFFFGWIVAGIELDPSLYFFCESERATDF